MKVVHVNKFIYTSMRYLKSYKIFESFEESDIQDVFEPYINWELVRDVQEMALEYIDEGMILNLEISYGKYLSVSKPPFYIYHMTYNHDGVKRTWKPESFNNLTEGPYELDPIDKSEMVYQFYLVDELGLYSKEEDKELESRIKEAYPNENINPYAI